MHLINYAKDTFTRNFKTQKYVFDNKKPINYCKFRERTNFSTSTIEYVRTDAVTYKLCSFFHKLLASSTRHSTMSGRSIRSWDNVRDRLTDLYIFFRTIVSSAIVVVL